MWSFIKEFCKTMGRDVSHIPKKNLDAMMHYTWPGNIRELKNVVENAMISNQGNTLYILPPEIAPSTGQGDLSFEGAERATIISVLKKTGGRIKGNGGAADVLMLKPSTLYSKMKKLGIDPASAIFS
jgi:DNA-binding NtrC family response regulator